MSGQTAKTTELGAVDAAPLLNINNIEVIYDHVILVLKGVSLQLIGIQVLFIPILDGMIYQKMDKNI